MNYNWIYYVLSFVVLPLLVAGVKTWFGNLYMRFEIIEKRLDETMTEKDIKELVSGTLNPLKEDLTEIKQLVNTLLENQLKNQK